MSSKNPSNAKFVVQLIDSSVSMRIILRYFEFKNDAYEFAKKQKQDFPLSEVRVFRISYKLIEDLK